MSDVTHLLRRWSDGDREALADLMPLVYDELHRLAGRHLRRERDGHTLQPTALVHEAYLRLAGLSEMRIADRAHFYGAAAGIMRRVLVDHARRRDAGKRGGPGLTVLPLDDSAEALVTATDDLVALDEALDGLARVAPAAVQVVELRCFGGLSVIEAGEYLGVSPATVKRHWKFARAWLFRALHGGDRDRP